MEMSLINYTKFRLKLGEEIWEIFKQVTQIFILACGKCYKRFEEENEEEYTHLL